MNANKPSTTRRNFLFALGAGSAGAAAVVITAGKIAPEKTAEQKADAQKSTGYTLSEHNQHYYRTTRI